MTGDLQIVLHQAAVVLGAVLGYTAATWALRRDRVRTVLLTLGAIAPCAAVGWFPTVAYAYGAAVIAGVVAGLAISRKEAKSPHHASEMSSL